MNNKLLTGISREDITPEIGGRLFGYRPDIYSDSINDKLTVTAFYFSQNNIKAFMITATVCLIDTSLCDSLREELSEKFGLSKNNIIISATHTHSGPALVNAIGWGDIDYEYYNSIFRPALIKACENAYKNAEPVSVGIASGTSNTGINRRELRIDNNVYLGQSPWGPYNPEMTVISFKTETGEIKGNIIHYGCHGTVAGPNTEISRDWSGVMTDAVDELSGGITAFFNGPEGDVGPRISTGGTTATIKFVPEVGNIAAADACNIFKTIDNYSNIDIAVASDTLKIPLKPRISKEEACHTLSELDENVFKFEKHICAYYKSVKESYENGYVEKDYGKVEQVIFRLGNIVFATFPYEMFSEIGMRIDTYTPDLKVLSLSNTNGSMSYLPTQDQISRGGYEIKCFLYNMTQSNVQQYTDDADYHVVKETLRNIERLEK